MQNAPRLSQIMPTEKVMSNTDYHKSGGINKSKLDDMDRSPLHAWERWINPKHVEEPPTPAMLLGSAYHKFQTEPDDFFNEFIIAPQINRRTKAGKEEYAKFENAAKGKTLVDDKDFTRIQAMCESVRNHPAASKLLALKGKPEVSITWKDYETGLDCKCRPDWYCPKDGILVDFKTTEDASERGFQRSVEKFRYHVQAAWYLRGVENCQSFIFIAVEKKAPYAVACYNASAEMLAAGGRAAERNLQQWARCLESKRWPSYADNIVNLDPPKWNND